MTSKEANRFVSRHIRKHREELHMSQKQSIAVALHEAREKGYDVPPGPRQWERSK